MMDQLASVGVEFDDKTIERIFQSNKDYYYSSNSTNPSANSAPEGLMGRVRRRWAIDPIFQNNHPVRPWSLSAIRNGATFIYKLMGEVGRSPGMYHRIDPSTGSPTTVYLEDTNERIHPSVRVRLALSGLGLDDADTWECSALRGNWDLRRAEGEQGAGKKPSNSGGAAADPATKWVWNYKGPEHNAPPIRQLEEEPLGHYEQLLLDLSAGMPNVFLFARDRALQTTQNHSNGASNGSG